ncbi:ABC transporter substrate-binding protein [Devosia psychrophila]|uniref:Peptide ABC transporter substrate-binding protein n=1 Tax=Devosia psychrophila TaxID=728005 RepID=A0A0F5PUB6_9HYPH|nr:ABC transporter substrate-binding protein [Devosia psychrophila]KKC31409.1 peptide ABC transporter substrate-binding protein [Devosia psychrophila]SFC93883.1 peptide/nickel transport system substrate-binding protein [Devosia psychrophila]
MKMLRAALLATALSLPLVAGAYAATPADALVIAQNIDDIVALDPAQAYEFTSGEINTNVYDRLVGYEAEDTTVLAPGLASEWVADDAAKTITFTLRDATFASGNPVRPEDVVFSFNRVITLNLTPAFILTQLGWTPENMADMVSIADGKVVVTYEGDFSSAFVLNVLASRPASIVDEVLVTENAVGEDLGNAWLNTHSAGSGPFVMSDYRPAEIVRLTANETYFRGAPAMKTIIIRHVAEAATQQLLLTSGDVDIAKNLTPDQIASLPADTVKVETFPQAAVHFLSFNQKTESLTPPAVWEAARYLVDYDGMTETFLKGQMEKHQAFWPKGFPGSYDETPFTYDVEKAKQILADAGVETPINVTLDVINSTPFTDIAQSLQAGFAEAGINFEILPGTGAQVITKYRERTHQAMLLYWGPDFMDPHSNAKAFAYNSDNSDATYTATTTWRNAWAVPQELNDKVTAALAEPDQAKRNEDYIEIQKEAQASSPIVIMFQAALTIAMANNVDGYVNGATSDFVYYRLVTKE